MLVGAVVLAVILIVIVVLIARRSPKSPQGTSVGTGPSSMGRVGDRPQLRFSNAAMGRAIARDPNDLYALLVKERMGHLVGKPYQHSETSDGGYIIYF